ncbi:hypothetical protein [Coleofasciculus sp. H7-2]|uniref:hypothetical protein n=1 Tax=Coleofasciculus sp. H7-2 TaxID=3351545 RepID=UPI003670570A
MQFNQRVTIFLLSLVSSFAMLVGVALVMRHAPRDRVTAIPTSPLPDSPKVNQDSTQASQPQPAASTEEPTPAKTLPAPSSEAIATAKPFPRRPIVLTDRAKPGSSFYAFRQRLRQAVRNRDAAFLRQIADPQIKLSFGLPLTIEQLEIANPKAVVWQHLERIINTGCAPYEVSADSSKSDAWTCPHVAEAPVGDPFADVYIVGTQINVRSQPEANSSVVAVLSNEVVPFDSKGAERLSQQQIQSMETWDGWKPVITPEGVRGYVSSRYAYIPSGYRARFENKQGKWKMTIFITGD